MTVRSTTDFLAYREKVRKTLHDKAKELKLDTTLADSVMGVGREIRILQQLVKENMSDTDYRELIRKLNRLWQI